MPYICLVWEENSTRLAGYLPAPGWLVSRAWPVKRPYLRCYDHSKPGKFLTFLTAYFVTTKFCLEQIFIIFVNFRCFSRRIKKFHGKMLFCSYPSQTPKFIIFQKKISVFFFFSHRRKKNHTRKVHFLQASANALKTLWISNKNWAKLTLLNGHEQKYRTFPDTSMIFFV